MSRDMDSMEKLLVGTISVATTFSTAYFAESIWLFVDSSTNFGLCNTLYVNSTNTHLFTLQPAWTLSFCGLLGMIAFPIALSAVCKPSENCLLAYIVYMTILLAMELVMTIVVMASWSTTKETLKNQMLTVMNEQYIGLPYSYTHSQYNSLILDKIMLNNKCCGINGQTDFTKDYLSYATEWYNGYRSHSLGNGTGYTTTIASACCSFSSSGITKMIDENDWLNYRDYLTNQLCPVDRSNSYGEGCYDTVSGTVFTVIMVNMGCYFIVIGLHLVGLIAAGIAHGEVKKVSVQTDWTDYQKKQPISTVSNGRQHRRAPEPTAYPRYGGGWGTHSYR